ncbi:hypothetical protein B0H13DRAFT_252079 [Mycena leptocephala]|nr:hypothetical protein B0H13DRAFT_252079 [Mycena leptocephala]
MALPQINLNLPAGLAADLQIPAQPANPPTAGDLKRAMKLQGEVLHELRLQTGIPDAVVEAVSLYTNDIMMARQLAQVAAPGAPAPLFPGVALILNAIGALDRRLTGRLDDAQRETAINGNIGKGTGNKIPYAEKSNQTSG